MPRCPGCGLILPDTQAVELHMKRHNAAKKAQATRARNKAEKEGQNEPN